MGPGPAQGPRPLALALALARCSGVPSGTRIALWGNGIIMGPSIQNAMPSVTAGVKSIRYDISLFSHIYNLIINPTARHC